MWITLHILITITTLPFIIIEKKGRSTATLSWLFFIWIVPFLGVLLWWLIGHEHLNRKLKRYQKSKKDDFFNYGIYPYRNITNPIFLTSPLHFYQTLITSILAAEKTIHMNFYIWDHGEVSQQIEEALLNRLAQNVEIRILVDSYGSYELTNSKFNKLKKNGAKVSFFMPFNFFGKNVRFNFRNHRKNCIIDSRIAFTGGINIGDRFQAWSDCGVAFSGDGVLDIQEIFANDWKFSANEDLFCEKYFTEQYKKLNEAQDMLRVISSGPDIPSYPLYDLLIEQIHQSSQSWTIITPYFVLDPSMLTLLRIARKRSIVVNIYIPEKSDSVILDMANRSCMDSLQELDIQIHFIQPPFMHAKIQIFDQQCIILGTSNFDIRSFKLNFETSLVLKSDYFSQEVNKFTQELISHSRPARDSLPQKNPFIRKLTDALVQIASPLL